MLDDPENFKTKEESKLGVLEDILEPAKNPELYGDVYHKVRINYYPPRGDNKEGWDNIDIFGWLGYPMQIKVDFLCRDSILAAPLALDLVLFSDLAQRAGLGGIQEWLSFYFKSPQVAPGLYPEHDLFIQLIKLKNTLRWMMGEDADHPPRPGLLPVLMVGTGRSERSGLASAALWLLPPCGGLPGGRAAARDHSLGIRGPKRHRPPPAFAAGARFVSRLDRVVAGRGATGTLATAWGCGRRGGLG